MTYEEKLEILSWISGVQLSIDDLKSCPDEFIVDAVVCTHLVKTRAMTAGEAKCLMTSITETNRSDAPLDEYPQRINERAFRLGFLYQKLFYIFHSCVSAVGLKIFQVFANFCLNFQELIKMFISGNHQV
jgi:hypothetical protein